MKRAGLAVSSSRFDIAFTLPFDPSSFALATGIFLGGSGIGGGGGCGRDAIAVGGFRVLKD